MHDQANELRRLVRQVALSATGRAALRPRLLVAASGKGGVGTTTVAVNLAVALQRQGHRAVLVDADPHGGNTALGCNPQPPWTVADVLVGRRTVRDTLQPGPGGILVLPGSWGVAGAWDGPPAAQEQLLAELQGLEGITEFVVVDLGIAATSAARRFWHAADCVILVTTPDTAAVMNAYAAVKVLGHASVPVCLVANMIHRLGAAEEFLRRLAHACQRFLGFEPQSADCLPWAPEVVRASQFAEPLVLAAPSSAVARQLDHLASRLANIRPSDAPRRQALATTANPVVHAARS